MPTSAGGQDETFDPEHRLLSVTESINRASDPEDVARIVAGEAARLCDTRMASIYLFTDDDELDRSIAFGIEPELAQELEKYGRTRWAVHDLAPSQRPHTVTLREEGPFPSPIHKRAASLGMRQLISLPLCYDGRTVGVLLLYRSTVQPLSRVSIDMLSTLANVGALAIVHARLIEARAWERKAQDQFLDVLSHELRTPLTSIMGYTQMIRRRFSMERNADPRTRDQLDLLWAQVQRLHRLLDNFVDMSNLERGEFTIGHERVDLAGVVNVAVEQVKAQARTRHHLVVTVPGHSVWIHGDMRRLEHAFIHVLSNAVRYSPVEQQIHVVCNEPENGEVIVSVIDHGPGIPGELRREIFKRFYPSDTRRTGGMGMGLYFSRAIVEAHGGRLTIESTPGQGTTVLINLPAK